MAAYRWYDEFGFVYLEVEQGDWLAQFSLIGAQLLSYMNKKDGTELFWLSPNVPETAGYSFRGGVPIVFPWFGPSEKGAPYPQHGFARNLPWRFLGISDNGDAIDVKFEVSDSPATTIFWSHKFKLTLTTRLRPSCVESIMTIENTDSKPFECEPLLHPYFLLEDLKKSKISGLDGAAYFDKNANGSGKVSGNITFGEPVDLVNEHSDNSYNIIEDGKPTFRITKKNSTQTVVWNPGPAGWLGDKLPNFVCVEPGCVKGGKLRLGPGEVHEMSGKFERLV